MFLKKVLLFILLGNSTFSVMGAENCQYNIDELLIEKKISIFKKNNEFVPKWQVNSRNFKLHHRNTCYLYYSESGDSGGVTYLLDMNHDVVDVTTGRYTLNYIMNCPKRMITEDQLVDVIIKNKKLGNFEDYKSYGFEYEVSRLRCRYGYEEFSYQNGEKLTKFRASIDYKGGVIFFNAY